MNRVWVNSEGLYLVEKNVSKWGIETFEYSFSPDLKKAVVQMFVPFQARRRFDLTPVEVIEKITRSIELRVV